MASDGHMGVRDSTAVEAAAQLLQRSWPALTALTPASIGLGTDQQSTIRFLEIVQMLSDSGLLTYEALLVNPDGPMLIDAALTARGRTELSSRQERKLRR